MSEWVIDIKDDRDNAQLELVDAISNNFAFTLMSCTHPN